ncbi:MAG: SNF2-related protein [Thermofilaceae archaeon]
MIELFPHQKEALEFLRKTGKGYISLPPGLGKTLIAASFIKEVNPKKVLIVAPKSAFPTWQKELDRLEIPKDKFILTNYEKISRNPIDFPIDMLVLDEAHRIKNISAKVTRNILKFSSVDIPKVLLSGTPFKDLTDLWTQYTLLQPGILHKRKDFIDMYFDKMLTPWGVKLIPRKGAKETILAKIAPLTFRKERSDFKQKITVKQYFPTSTEFSWENFKSLVAKEIYQEYGELPEEEFTKKFVEKAKGAFITLYKQACLNNTPKHEYIIEFLQDNPDTVVFTHFKEEAKLLAQKANAYLITGDTPQKEREMILKKQDKPIVFTLAFSEGANLNQYGNLIFSTIPSSPIQAKQIAGRIERLDSTKQALTFVLCLDEFNEKMYQLLKERITLETMFKKLAQK